MRLKHFTHVILSFLLLVGAFVAYAAWYRAVDQKSADSAAAQASILAKTQEEARVQEAKTQLAGLAGDEEQVQQYFVATRDVVPFLTNIEATGRTFGTKVSVVSVSASTEKPHGHLTLALSVEGSFDNVLRTIGALEYGPYDIVLQNLTLDTNGAQGAKAVWTAAATFVIGTTDATSTPPIVAPAMTASTTTATTTATKTP